MIYLPCAPSRSLSRHCRTIQSNCFYASSLSLPSRSSAMDIRSLQWQGVGVDFDEFNPSLTLVPGQSFNWRRLGTDDSWVGSLDGHPLIFAKDETQSRVACLDGSISGKELSALVHNYLQLDVNIKELYALWAQCCPRMRAVSIALPGIRLLNQDPWECLISFIFSSNNNIKRITKGLDLLRSRYGEYLCSVSKTVQPEGGVGTSYWCVQLPPIATRCDETSVSKKRKLESMTSSSTCDELEHKQSPLLAEATNEIFNLYSFPSVEALSNLSEQVFRDMGLGYRAKFLVGTTAIVRENRKDWLLNMRNRCREDVQNDLIALPGVGRKVADCVALFSMKQSDAVPIDTHVWDIVLRDYSSYIPIKQITSPAVGIIEASGSALSTPSKDTKTLTPHVYESIGAAFRSQFKSHAGWAHSVLFAGELPELRKLLPNEMQDEMLAFAANKAAKKKVLKLEKMDKGYKKDNEKDILTSITVENSHDSKSAHTLCCTPPVKQKVKSCKKMASTPTL